MIDKHNSNQHEIDYKNIGERIRLRRKEYDISQKQLADETNFSYSHISNIENGVAKVSINALVKIANAIGTTTDALLADSLKCRLLPMKNRIADRIDDCTDDEISIIADMVDALKQSLRKRQSTNSDK